MGLSSTGGPRYSSPLKLRDDVGVKSPSLLFFPSRAFNGMIFLYHFNFFDFDSGPDRLLALVVEVIESIAHSGVKKLTAEALELSASDSFFGDLVELRSQKDFDLSLSPSLNRERSEEGDFLIPLCFTLDGLARCGSSSMAVRSNMEDPARSLGGGGNIRGPASRTAST